ncbi:prolyl 3-hydroxylase OGFOD1-like, partial [Oncorhynchus mykiss]|uniref:prolyl 3-hydroxylase OGFOD1-like n=1 Tax=Oncorhynchus mykiss TaxID=8022 RepID=UPI0018779364
ILKLIVNDSEKGKKRKKSEERAELYALLEDEDVKRGVKEAWSQRARAGLFGWFRSWLGEVLGVELKPTVDISCAKYQYTDVLLCHDDELEGRRVAFILYFVPPWESSDGGTLDLFSADDHFQPHSVVKSLVPSWNTLVLFEVSPVSFHQVSRAVFGATPSSHRSPLAKEPPPSQRLLLEWLTPLHLDVDYQSQVQQELEDS